VTPSGTKIALIADDLAGFTEIPVGRVRAVVSRLAAPDLRILRPVASSVVDTADPRYEIYHDVLAPAVLDWRARFLGRSTISRRLAALIAVSVVISATAIQFVALPWPFISTLLRAIPLVVVNIAVLLQVYKWFSRYVRLTSGAFFATAYTEIGLVVPLGMLLTIYWYLSTQWDDVNALGAMETFNFIVYQFITAIFTLFFGSLTFLAMRSIGYLTNRFLKRFDLGFYGTYFVVCVLIAILIILQLLRPSPWIRIV